MTGQIVREQGENDYEPSDREPPRSAGRTWAFRLGGLGLAAVVYLLLGGAEMTDNARRMAQAVDVPLIADIGSGLLQPAGIIGSIIGAVIVLLIWTRVAGRRGARV